MLGSGADADYAVQKAWIRLNLRHRRRDRKVLSILVEDGLVAGIYVVRNPVKLTRLEEPVRMRC